MTAKPSPRSPKTEAALSITAAAFSMVLFALRSHRGMPLFALGLCGLLGTAIILAKSVITDRSPLLIFGFEARSPRGAVGCIAGIALGVGSGISHRLSLGLAPFPAEGVEAFVLIACLIGSCEELVYRGWLLGKARVFGWPSAIAIAAIAHAAYKTALFAWSAQPYPVDIPGIALLTLSGGLVLGLLRALAGSLLPPMLAHAAFDFMVYRSLADSPWWLW